MTRGSALIAAIGVGAAAVGWGASLLACRTTRCTHAVAQSATDRSAAEQGGAPSLEGGAHCAPAACVAEADPSDAAAAPRAPRPRVLVMMATYNGVRWLDEQVASILAQEGVEVTLRICDDHSSDGTFERCQELSARNANVVATQNERQLGVAENFMHMVYESASQGFDFYAFADQDDVWLPHKLAVATQVLREHPRATEPLLYFSDVLDFDETGQEYPDIVRYRECEAYPAVVLVRNYVNGCAMVWNASLHEVVCSWRPESFPRIHDVWLHMVGRFCGTVVADFDHALVRRRITGANAVGVVPTNVRTPRQIAELVRLALPPYERLETKTAALFLEGFAARLNEDGARVLPPFVDYARTLSGRLRMMRSRDLWLPTAQMRLRLRVGLLLGFY